MNVLPIRRSRRYHRDHLRTLIALGGHHRRPPSEAGSKLPARGRNGRRCHAPNARENLRNALPKPVGAIDVSYPTIDNITCTPFIACYRLVALDFPSRRDLVND